MVRALLTDDRGVMSPVAHSMTIAITSLLIIGLLLGTTAMLNNQQETATRDELRTVGERIASDIGHVDSLAQNGGSAAVTSRHVSDIAGSTYTVALEGGPDCNHPRLPSGTDTCLRLTSTERDATQYVAVNNDTDTRIDLESGPGGVFHLSAERQTAATEFSTRARLDLSARGGVGRDVNPTGTVLGSEPGNRPPIAKFTFSPASPTDNQRVSFDASESRDPDGNIVDYEWDWDGDGNYEETNGSPTASHKLPAGTHNVTLRVRDSQGTTSEFTRFIDVSGLLYNDDIDVVSGDPNSVSFSVTNNFSRDVEITHVMVDPVDDTNSYLDNDRDPEIEISGIDNGEYDEGGAIDIHDGGRIVELDDSATVQGDGGTATVEIRGFQKTISGERLNIGLQYIHNGTPNSTRFSDVPGAPSITNYRVTATGRDVDLAFESSLSLTDTEIVIGNESGVIETIGESDLDRTSSSIGYEYTYDISDGVSGVFWANMASAERGLDEATEPPLNDSAVTTSGSFLWANATDWDDFNESRSYGVVHDSFGTHSADRLELGYPAYDQGGDNLVGYWPLDETAATAVDVSGTGNDGTVQGSPGQAAGVFGTNSPTFNGSTDYVSIPDSSSIDMSTEDEVTISAWVQMPRSQGSEAAIFQHGESYDFHLESDSATFETTTDGFVGGDDWSASASGDLNSNQWYHVVGVYDGTYTRVYVDGNNEDVDGPFFGGTDPLEAGGTDAGLAENVDDPGRQFEGQIDEVRLYNRSLSATEVQELYTTHSNGRLTTDWVTGSAINGSDVGIQYNASIDAGDSIAVVVESRNDGSVETSDAAILSDGIGTVNVTGLNQRAAEYRVVTYFDSNSPGRSPSVDSLEVVDTS